MAGVSIFAWTRPLNNLYSPYKLVAYAACSSRRQHTQGLRARQSPEMCLLTYLFGALPRLSLQQTHADFYVSIGSTLGGSSGSWGPFAPHLEPFVSPRATIFEKSHRVDLVPLLAGRTCLGQRTKLGGRRHKLKRGCSISSSLWSHSGQQGWYGKPWRANLSAVQHLSNHRKNLQRSGAQDIHTVSLQGSKDVEPTKKRR